PRSNPSDSAADAFRRNILPEIPEEARVERMTRSQFEVQARADRVFIDGVVGRQLINVEIRIRRCARQKERLRSMKCIDDLRYRRNRLAFRKCAGSSFNKIDTVSEPVPFVASEEEHLVLDDGTAQ